MEEVTVIFFNLDMFKATGESDKSSIVLKLTEQQKQIIERQLKQGYEVLSIYPIIKQS